MAAADSQVAVIGGGVVGCAVAHALARRGVASVVLERETGLALAASGSNSGILHTGFDSKPGELETRLILRSAALREELLAELGVAVWRCGARLNPLDDEQLGAVAALAENARANGVEIVRGQDGTLSVPGEAVTDPVAFVHALAAAAQSGGATVRLGATVVALASAGDRGVAVGLESGEQLLARAVVNCAGLHADDVARLSGEDLLSVYPRKGEFLVFAQPERAPLRQILLPVPSALGKGVLVFPTIDGQLIAGPTARERTDKSDWSVEADARGLILPRARGMYPQLEQIEPIGAYAGLRPAGRDANYVIQSSRTMPALINVAAIRSTGLSASLGIGEHVVELLAAEAGIELGPTRPLAVPAIAPAGEPWWARAARRHEAAR